MGNEIAKKYDMPPESTASGGPGRLWKLYSAVQKQTGQPVTVFVLKKDDPVFKRVDKAKAEQLFEVMRRDLRNLQTQGHNRILRVLEVLEENKKVLAFVSERVVCSLADFHSRFEGISPDRVSHELTQMRFTDVEVGRGLYHIAEALQYLHNVGRKIHMDVCPENIFLSPQGHWKLGGMGFALGMESAMTPSPYFVRDPDSLPFRLEPSINFAAPEAVIGPVGRSVTVSADMFAMGILAIEAFTAQTNGYLTAARPAMPVPNSSLNMYEGAMSAATGMFNMETIPMGFRNTLAGLLTRDPATRLETSAVMTCPYFHTGGVALLCSIDTLQERDVSFQASFLSALPAQLHVFEARILKHTILPAVGRACMQTTKLWEFALPIIETVAGELTNDEFQRSVQPYLSKGLAVRNCIDTLKAFTKHIPWILDRSDKPFFREHILPALLAAAAHSDAALQADGLKMLANDKILADVDPDSLEQLFVPNICKTAVKTPHIVVRVQALLVLSKTLVKLPQPFLHKAILPTLKAIRQIDTTPAVTMCVLGCYDTIAGLMGPEQVCTALLPMLLPLLFDKQLNTRQFEMVSTRARVMLLKVLQARHLELGLPAPDLTVIPTSPGKLEPEVDMVMPDRPPPPVPKKKPSIPSTPAVEASPLEFTNPFQEPSNASTTRTPPQIPQNPPTVPIQAPPPIPLQPPSIPSVSPVVANATDIDALFANLEVRPSAAKAASRSESKVEIPSYDPSDPFAGLEIIDMSFNTSTNGSMDMGAFTSAPVTSFPSMPSAPAPAPAPVAAPAPAPIPAIPMTASARPRQSKPKDTEASSSSTRQAAKATKTSPPRGNLNGSTSNSSASLGGDLFSGLAVSPTAQTPTQFAPTSWPLATTPIQPSSAQIGGGAGGSVLDPFAGVDFTSGMSSTTPMTGNMGGFGGMPTSTSMGFSGMGSNPGMSSMQPTALNTGSAMPWMSSQPTATGTMGMSGGMSGGMASGMSSGMSGGMSGGMASGMSCMISGAMPSDMSGGMFGGIPAGMSSGMPAAGMSGGMPGGMSGMQSMQFGGMGTTGFGNTMGYPPQQFGMPNVGMQMGMPQMGMGTPMMPMQGTYATPAGQWPPQMAFMQGYPQQQQPPSAPR